MKVKIVVVTHRALPELRRCVAAVRRTGGAAHSLHVVDNASGAETSRFLRREAARGRLAFTLFRANKGKASAINHAVEADGGASDWLVILDDDAEPGEGWLETLLESARRHPDASILGALSLRPDGRVHSAEMLSWFGGVGFGERDEGQRGYTRYCDAVTGVCMMVRRDVFRGQRFWARLGQPCEDGDFCLEARRSGRRVLYCGAARIRHRNLRRYDSRPNAALMWRKWGVPVFGDSHPLDAAYARFWTALAGSRWEEMLRESRRLVRLDPLPGYAWGYAGFTSLALGRRDAARRAFRRALAERSVSPAFTAQALFALETIRRVEEPAALARLGRSFFRASRLNLAGASADLIA